MSISFAATHAFMHRFDHTEHRCQHTITLTNAETSDICQFVRQQQLPIEIFLQGSLALLLGYYLGAEEITFGYIHHTDLTLIRPWHMTIPAHQSVLAYLQGIAYQQSAIKPVSAPSSLEGNDTSQNTPLYDVQLLFCESESHFCGPYLHDQPLDDQSPHTIIRTEAEKWVNLIPFTLIVSYQVNLSLTLVTTNQRADAGALVRFLTHLRTLLGEMCHFPERLVTAVSPLTPPEKTQLLYTWNQTQADYPRDRCLHQLLVEQAQKTPQAVAARMFIANQSGVPFLTYADLDRRANQLAHYLRTLGIGPEVRVGIYLERSLDMLVALLGVLKAGGAYVPLDPGYPHERLAFMLADSGAKAIITRQDLAAIPLPGAACCYLDTHEAVVASHPDSMPTLLTTPENLAYVIYTSGSTGQPKGVQVTHRSLVNFLYAMRQKPGITAADILLSVTTLSFDIAALELFLPLTIGACVVIADRTIATDGLLLAQAVITSGATVMQATPATWRLLLQNNWAGNSRLKILCGGEAMPRQLADQLLSRSCELWNLYGPTETTVWSTAYQVLPGTESSISIGRPIANTQVYVLDKYGRFVPPGVPGELLIGGEGVARGYLDRSELTDLRFTTDDLRPSHSHSDNPRLYHTGDLVCWRMDGTLEFLGRLDHQVKIRGYRIELGEIEAVLLTHAQVRQAVVIAQQAAGKEPSLIAYLVPADPPPAKAELRHLLQSRLPAYMLPLGFVFLDTFPLTANGKIDRRALPVPDLRRIASDTPYAPPRTTWERRLVALFQEVLAVQPIGIDDDFFALGGNSLSGAALIGRLQQMLGQYLYITALFAAPTPARLSEYLRIHYAAAVGETETAVAPINAANITTMKRLLPPVPALHMPTTDKNPPAIFILSPPRSGSTLLRVMLAGHPNLFVPPELDLLNFATLNERHDYLSGANTFRQEGALRALMEIDGCDVTAARQRMAAYAAEGMTTAQFYRLLQTAVSPRCLVDKSVMYALQPEVLQRAEAVFANAFYIHLTRHPHGMIHSFTKAHLDRLYFQQQTEFAPRQLAELIWLISQQNIISFLETVPPQRWLRLSFADLVRQPQLVMETLCRRLGLTAHADMWHPYQNKTRRMTDGLHTADASRMVGDVKFHSYQQIDPTVADHWQQEVPTDFLSAASWEVATQLGYPRWQPAVPQPSSFAPIVRQPRQSTR